MQIILAAETSSFFLSDDVYLGKIASCCLVRNLNRNKTARKIGILDCRSLGKDDGSIV